MVMPILYVVGLREIVHAAGRACASLVAAAALAVHRTDVSRGVLLAGAVGFCLASSSVTVFVLVVSAAGGEAEYGDGQDGKEEFFHV